MDSNRRAREDPLAHGRTLSTHGSTSPPSPSLADAGSTPRTTLDKPGPSISGPHPPIPSRNFGLTSLTLAPALELTPLSPPSTALTNAIPGVAPFGSTGQKVKNRVEFVDWHMLDKLKFYPLSTSCSFAIRCMLYPFTLIKTRIQIQDQRAVYNGTFDAIRKIHRIEGFQGFYRGFWVNSFQVFSGIFYLSTYEGVRHLMATQLDIHHLVSRAFVGGMCASIVGQMITVPFDVVSQHMMLVGGKEVPTKKKLTKIDVIEVPPEALRTRYGVFQTIVAEVYRRHGVAGFYKGYWISVGTYAPHSALWWGYYHWYSDLMSKALPDIVPALLVQSISAPMAGMSAAILTNPIDVVRARVQVEGSCTTKEAFLKLWESERWKMMTKGLSARLIQSSFFSFFVALGYETVKRVSLKEEYKDAVPW